MRTTILIAFSVAGTVLTIAAGALIFVKIGANGFSARAKPSVLETLAAHQARAMAMPDSAKRRSNPVPASKEAVAAGMEHWADHCAVCHANDGSGQVDMGRQMYPRSPDMRKAGTQDLTDGEPFYAIENGIRLSGMPAWGGSRKGEEDSWKLVRFIRHLPDLTQEEVAKMERRNPRSAEDNELEQEQDQFLKGPTPEAVPTKSQHKGNKI